MRKKSLFYVVLMLIIACCMIACSNSPGTAPESVEEGGASGSEEPQIVEFPSVDGTQLTGTYYPPANPDATVVVLMHMLNSDRTAWDEFANRLYQDGTYAVLTFDFRGHGDSDGEFDRPLAIEDAKSALAYSQTLPGAAQDRVVLVGASIGSDAAVDACIDGCIAAASLSPGGWLGIPYDEALSQITDKPVLCVAAQNDGNTVETCESGQVVGMQTYDIHIYQGRAHGTSLFRVENQEPLIGDLLVDWLGRVAG